MACNASAFAGWAAKSAVERGEGPESDSGIGVPQAPQNLNAGGISAWQFGHSLGPPDGAAPAPPRGPVPGDGAPPIWPAAGGGPPLPAGTPGGGPAGGGAPGGGPPSPLGGGAPGGGSEGRCALGGGAPGGGPNDGGGAPGAAGGGPAGGGPPDGAGMPGNGELCPPSAATPPGGVGDRGSPAAADCPTSAIMVFIMATLPSSLGGAVNSAPQPRQNL